MYKSNKEKWKVGNNIPLDGKIYIVSGEYKDIRLALKNRGWFENIETNSQIFDYKWTRRHRDVDYSKLKSDQVVNHFQRNGELSTKVGLLHNIKNFPWFTGTDVDTFYPNSYDLADI